MDTHTADILRELDNEFYRTNADSFSQTRKAPWPGWRRCLEEFESSVGTRDESPVGVLDLACGNFRFERFLQDARPTMPWDICAVDACSELAHDVPDGVRFACEDVLRAIFDGRPLKTVRPNAFDLSVCFGFMHHVPGADNRERVLQTLIDSTKRGGVVALSLWRFARDADLAARAARTTRIACAERGITGLEPGDYLMDWKRLPGVYRYAHSFSSTEIEALAHAVADRADVIARFDSDGRTQDLNAYLLLRKR